MSSFDLNQASSLEEEEHDLCVPNHLFTALCHHSSDCSCITFDRRQQHEHKEILFMDGTSCNDDRGSIAPDPANESHRNDLKLSLCDPFCSLKQEKEEGVSGIREGNWVPSKMRLMRKMMKYSAHMIVSKPSDNQGAIQPGLGFPIQTTADKNNNDTNSNSTSPSGIIRVCSDCNTTKTPLWRSGPRGPKSLCNACGIRQRKARRAMAAALHGGVGLPSGGGHATAFMANKTRKETKLGIDRTDLPFKKRCKMNITPPPPPPPHPHPPKKLCFDDATLIASNKHNNSTVIQKVFPQEERDAAVLLMALSCGIIRS